SRLCHPLTVENSDRKTVEFPIRRLRNDLVYDLELGICTDPSRDGLAEFLTLLGPGCRKHLGPSDGSYTIPRVHSGHVHWLFLRTEACHPISLARKYPAV